VKAKKLARTIQDKEPSKEKEQREDKRRNSEKEIPCGGGARFSALVHTGPDAQPASYKMGTGFLSRG
jgi:hypothetical protein